MRSGAMGRGGDFGGEGEEEAARGEAGGPRMIEKMRRRAHQGRGGGGEGLRSPAIRAAARRLRAPVSLCSGAVAWLSIEQRLNKGGVFCCWGRMGISGPEYWEKTRYIDLFRFLMSCFRIQVEVIHRQHHRNDFLPFLQFCLVATVLIIYIRI
jgi:hypothetical protein